MSHFYDEKRWDAIKVIATVCAGGLTLVVLGFATFGIGFLLGAWR